MPIFNQSQARNAAGERVVQLIHLKSQNLNISHFHCNEIFYFTNICTKKVGLKFKTIL